MTDIASERPAEALREAGVPFLFTTGYGRDGVPDERQAYMVIPKPYRLQTLAFALRRALGA